jgi:hypothetical protein
MFLPTENARCCEAPLLKYRAYPLANGPSGFGRVNLLMIGFGDRDRSLEILGQPAISIEPSKGSCPLARQCWRAVCDSLLYDASGARLLRRAARGRRSVGRVVELPQVAASRARAGLPDRARHSCFGTVGDAPAGGRCWELRLSRGQLRSFGRRQRSERHVWQ